MTLADRIVVMNDRRIQQVGAPMEIYERPANLFVAGFVGTPKMNVVPVTRAADAGGFAAVTLGDGTTITTRVAAAQLPNDGALRLGLRAEAVGIVASGEGDTQGAVEFVERLGDRTLVYLKLSDGAEYRDHGRQHTRGHASRCVACKGIERERAGTGEGDAQRGGTDDEVVLVAAVGDEEAVLPVDRCSRHHHDGGDQCRRQRREQSKRQQQSADDLDITRGQRVTTAGAEAQRLEELTCHVRAVSSKPPEHLLTAVCRQGQSNGQPQ